MGVWRITASPFLKMKGRKNIELTANGILINGKKQVLLASSLFYFRIPRPDWEQRMQLLRAAGYNTIDVYFPWNYHEREKGKWDFNDNRDVEAFLDLAKKNDLFVIARPGPYICSEWDGGGLPAWLSQEKMVLRDDNPAFLAAMRDWYSHILPRIAPYQITEGGSMIMMQIENELDFFHCTSPVSYMSALRDMARGFGIQVPLFYCCGQNDVLRGGGLTKGLNTTFNVYADIHTDSLEDRALFLHDAAESRGIPFLVTETDRDHAYLKRLLACGAKLISPYNQTGGTTMELYNGITNWGNEENPAAFMASDYGFASMIAPDGSVSEEFVNGRLFHGLLRTLGEDIAEAVPERDPEGIRIEGGGGKLAKRTVFLRMKRGGLVSVVSLCDGENHCELVTESERIPVTFDRLGTKLLPLHVRPIRDLDFEIVSSSYEIAWAENRDGVPTLALYGEGPLYLHVKKGEEEKLIQEEPGGKQSFSVLGVTVLIGSSMEIGEAAFPDLPALTGKLGDQQVPVTDFSVETFPCSLTECTLGLERTGEIGTMEAHGQMYGLGVYHFRLPEGEYLFTDAADILTLQNGGRTRVFYRSGGILQTELSEGDTSLYAECWGHTNFDDIRCPSLQIGSQKGIRSAARVLGREDISENWMMDIDDMADGETCFFRHSEYNIVMGIDSYNRAESPLRCIYAKMIDTDRGDALFLHFGEDNAIVRVYVNGRYVTTVQKQNPWVDLSEFAMTGEVELVLRITRRYYTDRVGKTELIYGSLVKEAQYRKVCPVIGEGTAGKASLPLRLPDFSDTMLQVNFDEAAVSDAGDLYFQAKGRNVKLTFYCGSRILGRILTDNEIFPAVLGGASDRIAIPSSWIQKDGLQIWCQSFGKDAGLTSLSVTKVQPVIGF